jgi:hypothetical protein
VKILMLAGVKKFGVPGSQLRQNGICVFVRQPGNHSFTALDP